MSKYPVSQVIGYSQGKSANHLARVYGERKRSFAGQHFRARGYLVSAAGRDEAVVRAYIQQREQEDKRLDRLNLGIWSGHQGRYLAGGRFRVSN